jgi:Ribosomal protein L7/L12 C-terminal domain
VYDPNIIVRGNMPDRPYQELSDQQLDKLTQSLLDEIYHVNKEPDKSGLLGNRDKVLAKIAIRQAGRAEQFRNTSDDLLPMADVEIRVGHRERREAADELAGSLRVSGRAVAVTRYPVGWASPARGLTPIEEVAIFIGSGVATSLLNAFVTDVYNTAKSWPRQRFENNAQLRDAPTEVVRIFGPDNELLVYWELNKFGEDETNYYRPKEQFSVTLETAGDNRVEVMKKLRTIARVDVRQAKDVVDNAPVMLIEQTDDKAAAQVKTALKDAGATVIVRRHESDT